MITLETNVTTAITEKELFLAMPEDKLFPSNSPMPKCRNARRRRLPMAKYWFQRMRKIVEAAPDHLPATPTFPRFRKSAAPKPKQQSLSLAE